MVVPQCDYLAATKFARQDIPPATFVIKKCLLISVFSHIKTGNEVTKSRESGPYWFAEGDKRIAGNVDPGFCTMFALAKAKYYRYERRNETEENAFVFAVKN